MPRAKFWIAEAPQGYYNPFPLSSFPHLHRQAYDLVSYTGQWSTMGGDSTYQHLSESLHGMGDCAHHQCVVISMH